MARLDATTPWLPAATEQCSSKGKYRISTVDVKCKNDSLLVLLPVVLETWLLSSNILTIAIAIITGMPEWMLDPFQCSPSALLHVPQKGVVLLVSCRTWEACLILHQLLLDFLIPCCGLHSPRPPKENPLGPIYTLMTLQSSGRNSKHKLSHETDRMVQMSYSSLADGDFL
jgi:hypothetical protein